MATIIEERGVLEVGSDFVDAATGKVKSWGLATVGKKEYLWVSTLDQEASYSILRRCAEKEGKRWGSFASQALA